MAAEVSDKASSDADAAAAGKLVDVLDEPGTTGPEGHIRFAPKVTAPYLS